MEMEVGTYHIVSYRGLFTAGWFGVREKHCFRLKIYDRLRASEHAANWCLNAGEPLGPVQFILWPDVSYQVFIPIMSCFVTEIDQNCMKDVIDYDCNRKWTISSHSCTEFCKPSDVH